MNIDSITVGLPVADLEQAKRWYRQLFVGAEEIVPIDGVWEISPAPSFWLQFFETEVPEVSSKVVRFETGDVDAVQVLVRRISGGQVTEVELVPGAVRFFEFQDPFGNMLSFYEMLGRKAPAGRPGGIE